MPVMVWHLVSDTLTRSWPLQFFLGGVGFYQWELKALESPWKPEREFLTLNWEWIEFHWWSHLNTASHLNNGLFPVLFLFFCWHFSIYEGELTLFVYLPWEAFCLVSMWVCLNLDRPVTSWEDRKDCNWQHQLANTLMRPQTTDSGRMPCFGS
jgi:hypothetical protein